MAQLKKERIEESFKILQDKICNGLEEADESGRFKEDKWQREEGGGGRTRIITHGNVIEKGGVLFSAVFGKTPDKILRGLELKEGDFYATGISIVIHPKSPMLPIIHMNIRYFEMSNGERWFGGGIDLTPHYVNKEDATWFHQRLKNICDLYDPAYYYSFKKRADEYFYINHRKETRGIGGIFFDRLTDTHEEVFKNIYRFVLEVGNNFVSIYTYFIDKYKNTSYGEAQKKWQLLRRGRYVEFNLVYDKGTKFGLDTNGRTESILMSMPPIAEWEYNFVPEENTAEAATLGLLIKGINWIQ